MKILRWASLMLGLLVSVKGPAPGRVSTNPDRQLEAQVNAYIRPYLDLGGFNGSVLIAKGGRVLLSKGYGMANYELNVINTPWGLQD